MIIWSSIHSNYLYLFTQAFRGKAIIYLKRMQLKMMIFDYKALNCENRRLFGITSSSKNKTVLKVIEHQFKLEMAYKDAI